MEFIIFLVVVMVILLCWFITFIIFGIRNLFKYIDKKLKDGIL